MPFGLAPPRAGTRVLAGPAEGQAGLVGLEETEGQANPEDACPLGSRDPTRASERVPGSVRSATSWDRVSRGGGARAAPAPPERERGSARPRARWGPPAHPLGGQSLSLVFRRVSPPQAQAGPDESAPVQPAGVERPELDGPFEGLGQQRLSSVARMHATGSDPSAQLGQQPGVAAIAARVQSCPPGDRPAGSCSRGSGPPG
jgi:hypothetical protein